MNTNINEFVLTIYYLHILRFIFIDPLYYVYFSKIEAVMLTQFPL